MNGSRLAMPILAEQISKIMITTKLDYRHSYSREFGHEIHASKPERYVLVYSVLIEQQYIYAKIEHSEPGSFYHVMSRSDSVDKWLSFGSFHSMKDAKKHIENCYKDRQD